MRSKGSMAGKKVSQAQRDPQYGAIFLSPGRSLSLAEYRHATYFVIGKVCTLLPFCGIKCVRALFKRLQHLDGQLQRQLPFQCTYICFAVVAKVFPVVHRGDSASKPVGSNNIVSQKAHNFVLCAWRLRWSNRPTSHHLRVTAFGATTCVKTLQTFITS